MNSEEFKAILSRSENLTPEDVDQLQTLQDLYSFFQIPHVLLARKQALETPDQIPSAQSWAASTSPDRKWLKKILENGIASPDFRAKKSQKSNAKDTSNKNKSTTTPEDLIESIKRKKKQVILDTKKQEQIDLIKAFSEKDIKLATIREIEANQPNKNLAESSTQIKDELITESFAKLLARQGKTDKAIEIYDTLRLKFPDKSAYFADLIESLKNTD